MPAAPSVLIFTGALCRYLYIIGPGAAYVRVKDSQTVYVACASSLSVCIAYTNRNASSYLPNAQYRPNAALSTMNETML